MIKNKLTDDEINELAEFLAEREMESGDPGPLVAAYYAFMLGDKVEPFSDKEIRALMRDYKKSLK